MLGAIVLATSTTDNTEDTEDAEDETNWRYYV